MATPPDPHWDSVVSLLNFESDLTDEKGATWTASGGASVTGSGLELDGNSDYISTPNAAGHTPDDEWSIEAIFTPRGIGTTQAIAANRQISSGNEHCWQFTVHSSGNVRFAMWGASNTLILNLNGGATILSDDTEYHASVERDDSGVFYLAVDGVIQDSGTPSGSISCTEPLNIGYTNNGSSPDGDFEGDVRAFRMTKGAARGYTTAFTPPPAPLPGEPTHKVAGTVKQDGSTVSREIRVIDATDGELLATADSIGGSFDIGLVSADPVLVQAIPDEGYPPLIKGPYTPAEITP